MKKYSYVLLLTLILGGALMLYGCEGDVELSGTITVEENINVADATGTITGRVVDASTVDPTEGADVTLIVNGAKRTTTSATSDDEDLKGYFVFSGVPANIGTGVGYTLNISATGYADFTRRVLVPQTMDNTPVTVELGTIGLNKAFTLKVVVTNPGTPVEGAEVIAVPNGDACAGITSITWGVSSASYISAETNSDGIATLVGLNECYAYNITVPAFDADADGVYDYQTTVVAHDGGIDSDTTISIALTTAQRDDNIGILATSMDNNMTATFGTGALTDDGATGLTQTAGVDQFTGIPSTGTDDPIILVFNYPVALTGGLNASYVDDLIDPDTNGDGAWDIATGDTGYPEEKAVSPPASLDSTGTILTITPPTAGFPKNKVIDVRGVVTATVNGLTQNAEIDDLANGFSFVYIEDDTTASLSSITDVTADNYNGDDDDTTTAANVFLEFPEFVYGTYTVVSTGAAGSHAAGTETILNSDPVAIPTGTDSFVYTDGDTTSGAGRSGTPAGVFYRVQVDINADSAFTAADQLVDTAEIKIELDATDAVGNRVSGTTTLTVQ